MGFNPVELLKILLGPRPTEPWSALIPQIILWCFRRFCIQKLIESEGPLSESLWDDHHHLVFMYCPKGLESTSLDWMTPENMSSMHSSPEEYNEFFIKFIRHFDEIIVSEDYAEQDELSEFLDTQICEIIYEWLDGSPFSIFPTDLSEEDTFTDDKFQKLIDALMIHVSGKPSQAMSEAISETVSEPLQEPLQEPLPLPVPVQEPVPAQEPVPVQEPVPEPPSLLWQYLSIPPMLPPNFIAHTYIHTQYTSPEIFTPPPEAKEVVVSEPEKQEKERAAKPPPVSVARALAYRRTIRRSGRIQSRVKTRKSHPAL
jgi:hypothetical protein